MGSLSVSKGCFLCIWGLEIKREACLRSHWRLAMAPGNSFGSYPNAVANKATGGHFLILPLAPSEPGLRMGQVLFYLTLVFTHVPHDSSVR